MNTYTQPLYDTIQLAAATGNQMKFFQRAIGGLIAAVTKTLEFTNLTQVAQLPMGFHYTAKGMQLCVRLHAAGTTTRATLADFIIIQKGYLEIKINNVNKGVFPVNMIPSGAQDGAMFSNITAAATEYWLQKGAPLSSNYLPFDVPIEIPAQTSIEVQITVPGTVAAVTDVQFSFVGVMSEQN